MRLVFLTSAEMVVVQSRVVVLQISTCSLAKHSLVAALEYSGPGSASETPREQENTKEEGARTWSRSSCFMAEWMQMEGKLHSTSSLFSSFARITLFTKITTYGTQYHL